MKKLLLPLFAAVLALPLGAQIEPYEFKEYKQQNATSVKDQGQTSTCWAFSTASFLESEAMRNGKTGLDFSEMFIVRHMYRLKCENYVRRQGTAQLSQGGLSHDVLHAVARFGIAPESAYPARQEAGAPLNHNRIEKTLKSLCEDFVKQGKAGKLPADWLTKIDQALDEEFGPLPLKFTLNNATFTPVSYRDYLGINPDDYLTVTSFTHHPFWQPFVLEIPDNWANGAMYNLPLSEMMRCAKNAIDMGYTATWDMDNSHDGFSGSKGLAIVPLTPWKDKDGIAQASTFKMWEPEVKITQELRQQAFDQQTTSDDHLMHLVGLLDEKHSGLYYVVKNSWGEDSDRKGYVYCSEAFVRLNTISFTLHKKAIPEDIAKRLGLIPGDVNIENNRGGGKSGRKPEMELRPLANPKPPTPATPAPSRPKSSGN